MLTRSSEFIHLSRTRHDRRPIISIVDDHTIVRQTLLDWLVAELTFSDCRGYVSAEELFESMEMRPPDLVILDVSLPGMNGIDACRKLKEAHPHIPVLILTIHANPHYANEATAAGAEVFLRKDRVYAELIPAIRRLLAPAKASTRH